MKKSNGLERSINGFKGSKTKLGKSLWFLALSHLAGGASPKDQDWVMEQIGMEGKAHYLTLANAAVVGPTLSLAYWAGGQIPGWAGGISEWVDQPVEKIVNVYVHYKIVQDVVRLAYMDLRNVAGMIPRPIMSFTPHGLATTVGWRATRGIMERVSSKYN